MSSGTRIVTDALAAGGISSSVVPNDSEQLDVGFRRLMSMMNIWLSWGIVLGFTPIDAIGQELDEPEDAYNAIVDNLAVSMLHFYRIPITQELKANARVGLIQVKTLYQELTIPSKIPSSTLPRGQGNAKGIDAQVFFNPETDSLGS